MPSAVQRSQYEGGKVGQKNDAHVESKRLVLTRLTVHDRDVRAAISHDRREESQENDGNEATCYDQRSSNQYCNSLARRSLLNGVTVYPGCNIAIADR